MFAYMIGAYLNRVLITCYILIRNQTDVVKVTSLYTLRVIYTFDFRVCFRIKLVHFGEQKCIVCLIKPAGLMRNWTYV